MSDLTTGIMPEHMSAKADAEAPLDGSYDPSTEDKKIIKRVEKLFEKAKKYRAQYDEKWLEFYHMFRGKQWEHQRPAYRHSEVLNLVFQTIQSQVPIITDSRPKFEFLPQEPQDRELADILNDLAASDWASNNWQNIVTEVVYDGYIYGTGLSSLVLDPNKNKLDYRSSDPFYFFPDPSAEDVNNRCDFVIYAEPMDVAKIRQLWPEKGRFVKPDLVDLIRGAKSDIGPVKFKSPTDQRTVVEGSTLVDAGDKDKALVLTCYKKCVDMITEEKKDIDPETGAIILTQEERLKYPNGQKIVIANGVLLDAGPNPYEDGEFPYQKWVNYILPREFWGESEIAQLEGPQKTFNKLVSFVLDVLTLMGNPIWVVDYTADIDTDNLFNRPGQVVEKAPGSEVRREQGVQLQPFVMQIIDRMKEWFDQIGGSNDITRGVNPTGVTAASAIADLQNAAQTRIRQKSRNLDCYLQNLGQQYISRVFQFYTAPQVFRLTGKDGANKYFKFHVNTSEDGSKKAMVERFSDDGLSLGIVEHNIVGKFDVRVTTGSSLPFSKSEKEQRLYGLFDRQIIDSEEVLKGLEYPNWEAIKQRMDEKAAAMAQQQAAQPA